MISVQIRWLAVFTLLMVFSVNQFLERLGIGVPFLYSYLDDLIVIPLVLSVYHLWQMQVRKDPAYRLPLAVPALAFTGFSFHFEWLLPRYSARYTSDVWDIAMYATGALLYMIFFNRAERKKITVGPGNFSRS